MLQFNEIKLIELYDAVLKNDGMLVQKILSKITTNQYLETIFTTKILTGMLVIALEKGLNHSGQAIITYNSFSKNKISDKDLNIIQSYSQKNNLSYPLEPLSN